MAEEPIIDAVGESRRSFVKKLVVGGFAVPVITTFSTSGITSAYAQTANSKGAVELHHHLASHDHDRRDDHDRRAGG